MVSKQLKTGFVAGGLGLALLGGVIALSGGLNGFVMAQDSKKLVVFTASWCAGCRDVLPTINKVAAAKTVPVVTIDVESGQAPNQADSHGLAVPHRELPQVYLLHGNKAELVVDGNTYQMGQRSKVEAKLNSLL